jgi:prenyltransferase beta subunit
MGMMATALAALALTGPVGYLQAQQQADGGFGSPQTTAWVLLALHARGVESPEAERYLRVHEDELQVPTDLALAALALRGPAELLDRLPTAGPTLNSAIWTMLALRRGGRPVPSETLAYLLRGQSADGGFSWAKGVAPDSNDTAAAIQALRAAGVTGKPISRALAALARFRNADGGFALTRGRASDSQSTAWAIQAYLAAGKQPPRPAYAFLARMLQRDGSYRYSKQYAATPVWVTAQVVPALAGRPY